MTKMTILAGGLLFLSGCYFDLATEESGDGLLAREPAPSLPPPDDGAAWDVSGDEVWRSGTELDVNARLSGSIGLVRDFDVPAYRVQVDRFGTRETQIEVHVDAGAWVMARLVLDDEPGQGALTTGALVSLATPDSPAQEVVGCTGPAEFQYDYDGAAYQGTLEVQPSDDPAYVSVVFEASFEDYGETHHVAGTLDYPVEGVF